MFGAVFVEERAANHDKDCRQDNTAGDDDGAAVFTGPFQAVGCGVDELVVLKSFFGLLIH